MVSGVTTLEEGIFEGKEVVLKSVNISRMANAKEPAVLSVSI